MYIRLGEGNTRVLAPVGPGLIIPVGIQSHRVLQLGEEVALERAACTIAVDGERQLELFAEQAVTVRLTGGGPRVVDVRLCIREASQRGILRIPSNPA